MDDMKRRHLIEEGCARLRSDLTKIGGCGSIECSVFIEPAADRITGCSCLADTGKMSRVMAAYNGFRVWVVQTVDGESPIMGDEAAIKRVRELDAKAFGRG